MRPPGLATEDEMIGSRQERPTGKRRDSVEVGYALAERHGRQFRPIQRRHHRAFVVSVELDDRLASAGGRIEHQGLARDAAGRPGTK